MDPVNHPESHDDVADDVASCPGVARVARLHHLEDVVRGCARASKATNTLRAYRADLADFTLWCVDHGLERLPETPETCPIRALRAWRDVASIDSGPLFRPVNRHDQVQETRLADKGAARIVKRAAQRAWLDPTCYAGHSLRAGPATPAVAGGAPERAIMEQTGQRRVVMVRNYVRSATLFQENAAAYVRLQGDSAVFAYQARPRSLFLDDGRPLEFPNDVRVVITFDPNPGLGGPSPPGLTGVLGQPVRFSINANIGRTTVQLEQPLGEVTFEREIGGVHIQLSGPRLELLCRCTSRASFLTVLDVFHYILPLALGVTFPDAPTIATTSGCVGDVPFTWQVESAQGHFEVTTVERQHDKVAQAMKRLELLAAPANRRLLAGVSYFNRAVRLERSGATAFEFTGEVMLNFAKCLEVLFPAAGDVGSREGVRVGLTSLGYSVDDIETWFMPAMALRSQVDVAHVRLTLLSYEQLRTVQLYSETAEQKFREMIHRLLEAVERGSFSLTRYDDNGPDQTLTTVLERLRDNLQARETEAK